MITLEEAIKIVQDAGFIVSSKENNYWDIFPGDGYVIIECDEPILNLGDVITQGGVTGIYEDYNFIGRQALIKLIKDEE